MTDSKQKVIEEMYLAYQEADFLRRDPMEAAYTIAARHFQPSKPPSAIELTEMLFEQYAMVDDDTLSKGAQKLKNRLLGMARRAMQKDDRQPITSATEASVSNETDNKPDAAAGGDVVEWHPKYVEHGHFGEEIVRSTLLENHVYLQGNSGDVYRVWLDSVGMPSIECTERNAPLPTRPAIARAGQDAGALLDPDMPAQELRLHCGEMTAGEERTGRACIRWANSVRAEHPSVTVADLQPIREALMTARDNAQFVLDKCDHKYIPTIAIKDIRSAADMALAALEARAAKDGGA